jgi:hypothetical protein
LISVWREYPITRSRTVTEVTIFEHFCSAKSYGRAALRHCEPLQRRWRSAAFPRLGAASGLVMRLLEAGRPFDGASVAAA